MTISKFILVIIAVVCFALILSSCSTNRVVKGQLKEEFSLRIGQTAYIADENLKIEFVEVIEDSRCPRNVNCIWVGRVVVKVRIVTNASAHELILTQAGLTEEYATEEYQDYELSYQMEPYPEHGKTISRDQYRLLLLVAK